MDDFWGGLTKTARSDLDDALDDLSKALDNAPSKSYHLWDNPPSRVTTNWQQILSEHSKVYRGFGIKVSPDVYAKIFDEKTSLSDRADLVFRQIRSGGMHWSFDRGEAAGYAGQNAQRGDLRIILTAYPPSASDVITDERELKNNYVYGLGYENEIPVKPGTTMRLKQIEWAPGGPTPVLKSDDGGGWLSYQAGASVIAARVMAALKMTDTMKAYVRKLHGVGYDEAMLWTRNGGTWTDGELRKVRKAFVDRGIDPRSEEAFDEAWAGLQGTIPKWAASRQDVGVNMSKYFFYGTDEIGNTKIQRDGVIDEGRGDLIISTNFEDMHDSPIVLTLLLSYSWLYDHLDPAVREVVPNQQTFFNAMSGWSGELTVQSPIPASYIKVGPMGKTAGVGDIVSPQKFVSEVAGIWTNAWMYPDGKLWIVSRHEGYDEKFRDGMVRVVLTLSRGELNMDAEKPFTDEQIQSIRIIWAQGHLEHLYLGDGYSKTVEKHNLRISEIDPVLHDFNRSVKTSKSAALFNPSQMRSWESSKPWNLSRQDAEAQMVDGFWGKQTRGTESASWEKGYIRPAPEFYSYPEATRRAIAYHEAGHAMLEAAGGLMSLDDPLGIITLPGGRALGYNAEEVIAEAYSVLWTEPGWFEAHGAGQIRDLVIRLAHDAGFPLPG